MLSIVAYFMIILFLVLVCTKKMAAFTGLLISWRIFSINR